MNLIGAPLNRAVLSIFTEYLRDRSMMELVHKEYGLIGKVVRKFSKSDGEAIDLLQGTALGSLEPQALTTLAASLNQAEGMNLPRVETRIGAPVLQVVPLAIFV